MTSERKAYHKEYYLKNKRKITAQHKLYLSSLEARITYNNYHRKYYAINKIKMRSEQKIRRTLPNNKIKIKEYSAKNKARIITYKRKYRRTLKGKESNAKQYAKHQRTLGYNPLNSVFQGCNGHHLDNINVINIPQDLHTTIPHRQNCEDQMNKINIAAWNYMESQAY